MLDTQILAGALLAASRDSVMKARCAAWVEQHIDHEDLADIAKNTIAYVREMGDLDDEFCTAWCLTLVNGNHGHYVPAVLLSELVWREDWDLAREVYDAEVDFREEVESQGGILDNVLDVLAADLNKHKPGTLRGSYYAGYHEADGSLGIMYAEPVAN